jgi:hypothetical protein
MSPLQVEQLFADGSRPAIQSSLFHVEPTVAQRPTRSCPACSRQIVADVAGHVECAVCVAAGNQALAML